MSSSKLSGTHSTGAFLLIFVFLKMLVQMSLGSKAFGTLGALIGIHFVEANFMLDKFI